MKTLVRLRTFSFYVTTALLVGLYGLFSCDTSTPMAIVVPNPTTIIPPTIAGVQTVVGDQAEIVVKAGIEFGAADWQLTLVDAAGKPVGLSAGGLTQLQFFNLMLYRATGLVNGQSYTLRLATSNAGGDSVRVDRLYVHRPTGPRCIRRVHAPVVGGDFAASALSTDNTPGVESYGLSIWQLKSDDTWQALTYYVGNDSWLVNKVSYYQARHGLVRFSL